MEPARKGRKRSKSFYSEVNTDESANNADLNGDEPAKASDVAESNDGVETVGEAKSTPDEDIDTVKPKDGGVVESSNNSKSKGRKRKASDMESGDDDSVVSDEGSKGTIDKENVNKGTNASDKSNDGEEKKTDDQKKEKDNAKAAEFETNLDKDNASVSSSESTDMNILTPQDMGKGKRARIPNKRYSDILLSPVSKQRAALVENGEKIEAEIETPKPATSSSGIATPTHISKKPKLAIDVKDPIFLLPIEQGWKRELVYRANDRHGKRDGDVYYYTPTGKKVRSMREVSENLKNTDLTLNNFTFFKEPLGLDDPEKEIIRVAVPKSKSVVKEASKKVLIPKSPKPKPEVVSKVMNPKVLLKRVSPRYHVSSETAQESPGKPKTPAKLGNFKIKLPPKKMEKKAKLDESSSSDSPSTSSTTKWPAKKTGNWNKKNKESPRTPKKKPISKLNSSTSVSTSEKTDEVKSMNNYLQQISYGYNTLLYVFQYLKVQDLLRAGCVCNMWRDIASHPYLWRTVRMKNSQVHSFEGLANTLQKHGTVHLDLRKMLLPNGGDEIWPHFNKAIEKVTTLRKIELCRCPASVVEHLATSNPKLEVINAVTIKCENMNLDQFSKLQDLKELRLKSTSGLTLTSNLDALKDLTNLKHLSLTSIRDLNKLNLNIISELTNLESLDLGECNDFPKTFGTDILEKLKKLEKLRLEKGQGNCYTFDILEAVKNMPQLEQLELVNFDIKAGFDKALGGCANIKRLLIIPTYISQSATTNHMVLGGVLRLQKTLSHFVWGVTLELLRVTELFVDQCEEPDSGKENGKDKVKKPTGNGDSIPVLKPVPSIGDKFNMDIPPAHDPPQVEILPLPNLQKLLLQSLPTTRVKILKIPFHATWRQSITDTVN